jgi:hypothetical protein
MKRMSQSSGLTLFHLFWSAGKDRDYIDDLILILLEDTYKTDLCLDQRMLTTFIIYVH